MPASWTPLLPTMVTRPMPPTFTNTYTAKGSVELTATKIVAVAPGFTHDTKLKGGEYTFELKDADGKVLGTTTNKADGTVKFTRKFTLSNLGGAASKDFTYTIAGEAGHGAGHGLRHPCAHLQGDGRGRWHRLADGHRR